jgi:hypothetical protein
MQLGSGEISSHITMGLLIVNRELLLSSLKTLSIFWNSGAILNGGAILSRSPFALFVLLYSSSWRLPMQLLSGKL